MCSYRVLVVAIMTLVNSSALADDISVNITINGESAPNQVSVERENDVNRIILTRDPTDGAFKTQLPRPSAEELIESASVMKPYLLVGSWGSSKEVLYFGLNAASTSTVTLSLYHQSDATKFVPATLDRIESLGTDFQSILEKYFLARAFHRHWRYDAGAPRHSIAIRSAKDWFDASAKLVFRDSSLFRSDPEVIQILQDYEILAKTDQAFRRRLRQYVAPGYIEGMQQQMVAAAYSFVGKIPDLVSAGQVQTAKTLNDIASKSLGAEPEQVQGQVMKWQRINVQVLHANGDFIAASYKDDKI